MSSSEEAPRPVADVAFETLVNTHIKHAVDPGVYTRLMEAVDAVARAHYGRGYIAGGQAERF
jgi:hypothetical protein